MILGRVTGGQRFSISRYGKVLWHHLARKTPASGWVCSWIVVAPHPGSSGAHSGARWRCADACAMRATDKLTNPQQGFEPSTVYYVAP